MAECLICDRETGGEYIKYCPDHVPHPHKAKVKTRLGTSGKALKTCKRCGKEWIAQRHVEICQECYRKQLKRQGW